MIRVLEINGYAMLYRGAEVLLLNIYKHVNPKEVHMDFLTPHNCRNNQMRTEIESRGGKIYEMNAVDKPILNKFVFFKLVNFIKNNNYDIIHIHTGSVVYMALACLAAKVAGSKIIIAHSHSSADVSTAKMGGWKVKLFRPIIQQCSDYKWACSDKAAEYMFGVNQCSYIMNNGIDLQKFTFSADSRIKIRRKLAIKDDEKVIGCVAQFTKAKNHKFLIDVFECLTKQNGNVKLLLVGEGELIDDIRQMVVDKGLADKTIFYGVSENIPEVLSAMDVFALPSYFEGLPVSCIEAQCSGLHCFVSDRVSRQLNVTGNITFLPIDQEINRWCESISEELSSVHRDLDAPKKLKNRMFDIDDVAKEVCVQYKNMIG